MSSKLYGLVVVTILSFFTYFYQYTNPPYFFWDENYHIASAQKYLHGVFFMEPHPPLGKMLIALGEKLIAPNAASNQWLGTDYAKDLPEHFSFSGYRFFPSLLGWLCAPLLYLILLSVTGSVVIAFLCAFPLIFDTALIVHSRSAMLEPIQLFFILLAILVSVQVTYPPGRKSLLFGIAAGCAVATKLTGLITLCLLPLLWYGLPKGAIVRSGCIVVTGTLVLPLLVWIGHIVIGRSVVTSLPDGGMYQASGSYAKMLSTSDVLSGDVLITAIRDHINFVSHYNRGVPQLNLCKVGENGSMPILWPLGARSINYRWERSGDTTKYLYLQANPFAWGVSLLGVLAGFGILFSRCISHVRTSFTQVDISLLTLSGLWLCYMALIMTLDRVMYLYHYFIPLVAGFILFGLVVTKITHVFGREVTSMQKSVTTGICAVLVLVGFVIFSPFAYYKPLTDQEVRSRAWVSLWDLRCQNCKPVNTYARPEKAAK